MISYSFFRGKKKNKQNQSPEDPDQFPTVNTPTKPIS